MKNVQSKKFRNSKKTYKGPFKIDRRKPRNVCPKICTSYRRTSNISKLMATIQEVIFYGTEASRHEYSNFRAGNG